MSLRMNLRGWSFERFRKVLGSNSADVLDAAAAILDEALQEPDRSKGKAWLRKLIEDGVVFAKDRPFPTEPADGGLLTMQMERETHIAVVYGIVRAMFEKDHLDLTEESSDWAYPCITSLGRELQACGFTKPTNDDRKPWALNYFRVMPALESGTPLFGDGFRTSWSLYTTLTNKDLADIIPIFRLAIDFRKGFPKDFPEELKAQYTTELSPAGKEFVADLIKWFTRIQDAGQDAFILWY